MPRKERAHRGWVAAILALAVIIGVFAVLSVWVNRQVLNTETGRTTARDCSKTRRSDGVSAVLVNELFKNMTSQRN